MNFWENGEPAPINRGHTMVWTSLSEDKLYEGGNKLYIIPLTLTYREGIKISKDILDNAYTI